MKPRFPGQKEGEEIKTIIRKHWIIYVKLGLLVLMFAIIPSVLFFWFEIGFSFWDPDPNSKRIMTTFFLLYLQIVALFVFIRWMEEEMDLIIVTNERIISIDQISFLHRTISETELSQVQDVKHVAKGLLANMLGFGSMEVQTAAEKITFTIHDVPQPYEKGRQIMDLCNHYKREFAEKHYGQQKNIS